MAEYYVYLEEYESAAETCRKGFPILDTELAVYGARLDK